MPCLLPEPEIDGVGWSSPTHFDERGPKRFRSPPPHSVGKLTTLLEGKRQHEALISSQDRI